MRVTKCFSVRCLSGQPLAEAVQGALTGTAEFAAEARLDPVAAARLAVIVDELVGNLLRHGRASCEIQIALALVSEAGVVRLVLEDNCMPFDPRRATFAGPDDASGGGVGLALVRGLAEIEDYASVDGINRLTLRLRG